MRVAACLALTVLVAACTGAGPTGGSAGTSGTSAAPSAAGPSAAAPPSTASPGAVDSPIVGEWVRTATCDEALAAFQAAGLSDQVSDWVVGNYVEEGAAAAPGDECAAARPAVPHSHFFTAAGRFGSRDEHGQDVDDGDYVLVDADTLSFPSATRDFGSASDVLVDFAIAGDEITFSVTVPTPCDDGCRVAYAWALSAFFGPRPFQRI